MDSWFDIDISRIGDQLEIGYEPVALSLGDVKKNNLHAYLTASFPQIRSDST